MTRTAHPRPRRAPGTLFTGLVSSSALAALVVFGFWASDEAFTHWFVLPLLACGTVIGVDMLDWLRGRLDTYDPVGIIGLLGYHFFFLAPLLHVRWDYWMGQVAPPPDWRDWLGAMALLNLLGLLVYRASREAFATRPLRERRRPVARRLRPRAFFIAVSIALLLSAALQVDAYARLGGISGYIAAFDANDGGFEGSGLIFVLSEKFPLFALLAFAVYMRRRGRSISSAGILAVLLVYLVLTLLFGGLRGSRSNTIWSLFWATGIIHYWLRPLPRKLIYIGVLFIGLFMYVYGFYKSGGSGAVVAVFEDRGEIEILERRSGRGVEMMILGDLARADVQALVLHRMFHGDYELAHGRTYIGAAALLIPRSVWTDRPLDKRREGTQVQFGMDAFRPGGFLSSRVYGLTGEFMLNFGPALAPLAFSALGFVVGRTRRLMQSIDAEDVRWLLLPFLINLCFVVLVMDSDNVLFFSVKNGLFPACVVYLGSQAVRTAPCRSSQTRDLRT